MKNKIWAEKYRPLEQERYVFPTSELERNFNRWISQDEIFPNLILCGIQGTGKSTLAKMLTIAFCIDKNELLRVNGSSNNKLELIREEIEPFCKVRPISSPFKVVLIEEAHRLTPAAQESLFDIIEMWSETTRFIFTTNYVNKLKPALRSRCEEYDFNSHDKESVLECLADILTEEDVSVEEDESIVEKLEAHYSKFYPDIRSMIHSLQRSIGTDGILTYPDNKLTPGGDNGLESWESLWSQADQFTISKALKLCDGIDDSNYDEYYRVVYENLPAIMEDNMDLVGPIVIEISDYLFKAQNTLGQSAIQRIHLESFLFKMEMIVNGE